jgi:hypothetical protein
MMPRPFTCAFIGILRDLLLIGPAAAAVSLVMILTVPTTAHAEWFAGAEIREIYDGNVNLAIADKDRKSDTSLLTSISFGRYFPLAFSTGLSVSAEAKYTDFARFSGLDNFEAGLSASLKYKQGLGSYAPWVKIFGSAKYVDYREEFRDGNLLRSGLSLGKRIYERVFTQIGYEYDNGSARNSRFGTRSSIVSARIDFLLTETVQMWAGYARSRGIYQIYVPADGTRPAVPGAVIVNTFGGPSNVFQVLASTQVFSIGASMALASHWSADISADFVDIYGRGREYPDTIYKAGIVYAY